MHCPRINHFIRIQPSGKISKCGHMVSPQEFETFEELEKSDWTANLKKTMELGKWPKECVRCQTTEQLNQRSIRTDMIERDKLLRPIRKDYIIVGGILDNVCNSACQSCNETLSTKIGSLTNKNYLQVNNYEKFKDLPQERIIELDINGGEPTASKNYQRLINDLPPNIKIIRINTNGKKVMPNIESVLDRGVRTIVTLSFDGLYATHDYLRWPVKFVEVKQSIKYYQSLMYRYRKLFRLNLWTTVSALNIYELDQIINYAESRNIDHAYAFLQDPHQLNIKYSNYFTKKAKLKFSTHKDTKFQKFSEFIATDTDNNEQLKNFIKTQDLLRGISINDYLNLALNLS